MQLHSHEFFGPISQLQTSPDEEGIETIEHTCRRRSSCDKLQTSPDEEGIETRMCIKGDCIKLTNCRHPLMKKGLKPMILFHQIVDRGLVSIADIP